MSVEKERVNMTFTKPYLDFMTRLVKNGMYFNRGAVMMDALRLLAKEEGISIIPEEAEGQ